MLLRLYTDADYSHKTLKLSEVFKLLLPMASQWQEIAVLLEIPHFETEMIKQENARVKGCLLAMVTKWFKQANPRPSWNMLAQAVEALGNQAMAEDIRKKYIR